MNNNYEVIVIGSGHAGCESALACARKGHKTLMLDVYEGVSNDKIPENSLLAYKNAIDNGYPIEIDVHKSKDGVLVLFHDDSLDRVTGKTGAISDYTLKELKSFSVNKDGIVDKIKDLNNNHSVAVYRIEKTLQDYFEDIYGEKISNARFNVYKVYNKDMRLVAEANNLLEVRLVIDMIKG